jgi:hypothetical protein
MTMKHVPKSLQFLVLGVTFVGVCGCSSQPEKSTVVRLPEPPGLADSDDLLQDKHPAFYDTRIDSRLLDGWEVNQSGAVIKLDSPKIDPGYQPELLELAPSYAKCVRGHAVFPSANLLDGAAKQFDDGLYAALDLACYKGELGGAMPGAVNVVSEIFDRLQEDSPAKPFLAAALQLAGKEPSLSRNAAKVRDQLLKEFQSDTVASKPISFYTWTPELESVWKFYRFLQKEFADKKELEIPKAVANVLADNAGLLKEYEAVQQFYGRLTNPLICLPASALTEGTDDLAALAKRHNARHAAVAIFPPSTSRESELFERVFPGGIPGNVEAMTELIKRIRSGDVNLQPKPDDGWYQYQVYALECLLNPGRNQESERLLLTADYKKRLTEAFKVMFAKRRETHARQLLQGKSAASLPSATRPTHVAPRLRIEPCPTLYLRNARAYAFLQNFLRATVSAENMKALHGLREGGSRAPNLDDELESMRLRTYGLYLVSCEDIGMAPKFLDGEPVDQEVAKKTALEWLGQIGKDPDLVCDTRMAVPIYCDPTTKRTRLWVTLGVRMARLDASYARAPRIRPQKEGGPWQEVRDHELVSQDALLPVDEFAEVEVDADKIPNRAELSALCDKYKTKEDIVKALQGL